MVPVLLLILFALFPVLAYGESTCAAAEDCIGDASGSQTPAGARSMLQVGGPKMIQDFDFVQKQACKKERACDPMGQFFRNSSLLGVGGKKKAASAGSFDCPSSEAIQVINTDQGADVMKLVIATGVYETMFSLNKHVSPSWGNINGAAISHLDSFGYAALKIAPEKWVMARFDASGLQFLGKLPGDGSYVSGAMARSGDYYVMSNANGGVPGHILIVPDPSKLAHTTNQVSALQEIQADSHPVDMKCGDIVVLSEDIGKGKHTLVIGIEAKNGDLFVDIYDVDDQQLYKLTNNLPFDGSGSWGSGWSFAGGAYFASNAGLGVYQIGMRSVDLNALTVDTRAVGTSVGVGGNDGMNCVNAYSPFPGCEFFCLDVGCPCMVGVEERCALASCEQCPYCF